MSDLLNQPSTTNEFYIGRFEEMVNTGNVEFPHRHDFYEILWITKGNSKQAIDYNEYKIGRYSLFFISPGQLHLFEEWHGVEGYCIMFTEGFSLQLFQNKSILFELRYLDNLSVNPYIQLDNQSAAILQPLVDLLMIESSPEIIQGLLFILLKKIQKLFFGAVVDRTIKRQIVVFKKFRHLVEQNFIRQLTLTEYADMLNVTAHYLNNSVKYTCNKTASDIIKERIILEAKQLLQFSGKSISEISALLSFKDSSYFSRFFKKNTDFSPLEFRKKR